MRNTIELWKPIPGYEGLYEVSNTGKVKSFKKYVIGKLLSPSKNIRGYLVVLLTKNGQRKHFVHRLVMNAFNPTNNLDLFVNHINGTKGDNRLENLEWVTYSQNMKHAVRLGLQRTTRRKVVRIDDGVVFNSLSDAAKKINVSVSRICECCQGKVKKCKGYQFAYLAGGNEVWRD